MVGNLHPRPHSYYAMHLFVPRLPLNPNSIPPFPRPQFLLPPLPTPAWAVGCSHLGSTRGEASFPGRQNEGTAKGNLGKDKGGGTNCLRGQQTGYKGGTNLPW